MHVATLLLGLSLLAACHTQAVEAGEVSAPDRAGPPEANRLRADHLPTPFSAAQIRDACSSGAVREFRIAGGPRTVTQVFLFLDSDEEGTTLEVKSFDPTGELVSSQAVPKTAWSSLQAHASYPLSNTVLERGEVDIVAGHFDCWVYTTHLAEGGASKTYFAVTLPGPPILAVELTSAGAELKRTELLRYE